MATTNCSVPDFENHNVFDADVCLGRVREFLGNLTSPTDACMKTLFVHGRNVTPSNPYVTYEGCKQFCGPRGWYIDPGERVTNWIIPIFFLLSNIDLSPIDRRRFFAIIHALGDPIDTLWSLFDKLYAWYKCYEAAKELSGDPRPKGIKNEHRTRTIATVLAGFEEIAGHAIESKQYYETIARTLGQIGTTQESKEAFNEWRLAAVTLVDDRTNEFLRTGLAIVLYLFQVISEFLDCISGEKQSTPNGRIAAAIMLSWLIPVTLMSNALGGFPSRRTCLMSMIRLISATNPTNHTGDESQVLVKCASWNDYFDQLTSFGAIYTFRPFKARRLLHSKGREKVARILILLLAVAPVVLAFTPAFALLWKADPNGFSCRHLWVTGVFVAWLVNAAFTSILNQWVRGSRHWWICFIKDTIIGLSSITVLFLSVVGLFNSCYCWSLRLWLGDAAFFHLEKKTLLLHYKATIYPIITALFLGLQVILVFVFVMYYRKGLIVNRWGEKHKRLEWETLVGKWRLERWSLFLFWKPHDGLPRLSV